MEETALTADEIEAIKGATDVEVEAVPTVFDLYRCKRGHTQHGSGITEAKSHQTGEVFASTGPSCIACQLEYIGKKFPTKKVG